MKKLLLSLAFFCVFSSVFAYEYADERLKHYVEKQDIDGIKAWLSVNSANKNYVIPGSDLTVLMLACQKNWKEGVRFLLEKDCNVDYRNSQKQTALMIAAKFNQDDAIVNMLLDKGANVENVDKEKRTPLMYACEAGNSAIVEVLIDHNASLAAQSIDGNTAIMYAVRKGKIKVVRRLLQEPDDSPAMSNNKGENILTIAMTSAGDPTVMLRTIRDGNSGISPSIKTANDMPVLLWAIANRKSPEVIKILLDWYQPPELIFDVKDNMGNDIEYYAKKYKNNLVRKHIEFARD